MAAVGWRRDALVTALSYAWMLFGLAVFSATLVIVLLDLLPDAYVFDNRGWNNFNDHIDSLFFGLLSVILFGWFYVGAAFIWQINLVPYQLMFAKHKPAEYDPDPNSLLGTHPFYPSAGLVDCCARSPWRDRVHDALHAGLVASLVSVGVGFCIIGYWTYASISGAASSFFPSSTFTLVAFLFAAYFFVAHFVPPFSSTRYSLGVLLKEVLVSAVFPVFGVDFVHVVIADALTSAGTTLWDLEQALCFFFSGSFLANRHSFSQRCSEPSWNWVLLNPIMSALPYWIRFVQCLYRVGATRNIRYSWGHTHNYVNAAKYASCLAVVLTSSIHARFGEGESGITFWLWIVALIIKTIYCYVWDVLMDWDLCYVRAYPPLTDKLYEDTIRRSGVHLQRNSSRCYSYPPLLRPERIYKWTVFYYVAIVSNLFMRASWSIAISVNGLSALGLPPAWKPLMALVEILRRAQWAVFRVENEALQVARKRRAVYKAWSSSTAAAGGGGGGGGGAGGGPSLSDGKDPSPPSKHTHRRRHEEYASWSDGGAHEDTSPLVLDQRSGRGGGGGGGHVTASNATTAAGEEEQHIIPHAPWDAPLYSSDRSDVSVYQLYPGGRADVGETDSPMEAQEKEEEVFYGMRFSNFSNTTIPHSARPSLPTWIAASTTTLPSTTRVSPGSRVRKRSHSAGGASGAPSETQPLLSTSLPTLEDGEGDIEVHHRHQHFVHRFN